MLEGALGRTQANFESRLVSRGKWVNDGSLDVIHLTVCNIRCREGDWQEGYFEFRSGVHDDVLDFIRRNAERIGAEFDVYR